MQVSAAISLLHLGTQSNNSKSLGLLHISRSEPFSVKWVGRAVCIVHSTQPSVEAYSFKHESDHSSSHFACFIPHKLQICLENIAASNLPEAQN